MIFIVPFSWFLGRWEVLATSGVSAQICNDYAFSNSWDLSESLPSSVFLHVALWYCLVPTPLTYAGLYTSDPRKRFWLCLHYWGWTALRCRWQFGSNRVRDSDAKSGWSTPTQNISGDERGELTEGFSRIGSPSIFPFQLQSHIWSKFWGLEFRV